MSYFNTMYGTDDENTQLPVEMIATVNGFSRENQPIIELGKELIRCKDCKHQRKEYHDDKGGIDDGYYIRGYFIYWCEKANGYSPLGFDNQYCSEADRKETK